MFAAAPFRPLPTRPWRVDLCESLVVLQIVKRAVYCSLQRGWPPRARFECENSNYRLGQAKMSCGSPLDVYFSAAVRIACSGNHGQCGMSSYQYGRQEAAQKNKVDSCPQVYFSGPAHGAATALVTRCGLKARHLLVTSTSHSMSLALPKLGLKPAHFRRGTLLHGRGRPPRTPALLQRFSPGAVTSAPPPAWHTCRSAPI